MRPQENIQHALEDRRIAAQMLACACLGRPRRTPIGRMLAACGGYEAMARAR
jgi:hypothetical protein